MSTQFTPLFTGGSGRSGTTIIINLLKSHPDIHSSLPREIKYLTSRYGLLDLNFGRSIKLEEDYQGVRNNLLASLNNRIGKRKEEIFLKFLSDKWWSETGKAGKPRGLVQGITQEQLAQFSSEFKDNYRENLLEASRRLYFQLSAAQFKKDNVRYFADSTPVNTMQADLIHRILPDALFINMIRDGRDVALSVAAEKWGPNDPLKALKWWGNRVLVSHLALAKVPTEQVLNIRLEELISFDRDYQYSRVLDFLKISDHSSTRDFFVNQMQPEKMTQGEWKRKVKDPVGFDDEYDKVLAKLTAHGITVSKFY